MDEAGYMQRCLELARLGEGFTTPNPMVGSVIVHHNRIIGEGYHKAYGEPHAEINAIESVEDRSLLPESTLYVNLEPCSHQGKTPPCSDRIIREGISRVVVGTEDPHEHVAGKGIEKMQNAGIEVNTGILKEECFYLNRAFFTWHTSARPYTILKWAQTIDGFIDIDRNPGESPHVNWITGESLKMLVHRWRACNSAILVGTATAINDDPALTVREWTDNNPLRLVVDEYHTLPEDLKLFNQKVPTVVFCREPQENKSNLEYIALDFDRSIAPQILVFLYERNIQSLIVEGGRLMLDTFIYEGLWDEIRLLIGDKFFYKGLKAPSIPKYARTIDHIDNDSLIHILNHQNPYLDAKH